MQHRHRSESPVTTADTDRHLLARARLGDTAAFEQLFHRYYQPVRQLLYRMLRDEALADDLTQEAFLTLHMHPPQLTHDDESLQAWLYRVALNRGYNTLRARRRGQDRLQALAFAEAAAPPDPEAEAMRAEECARVRAALATLPERQAKLLVLRQQEGLKYSELAAILEVAPGSIGTLLVRAERAFELAWNALNGPVARRQTGKGGQH